MVASVTEVCAFSKGNLQRFGCRAISDKVLDPEGSAGPALQVLFKGCGFGSVCKAEIGDDFPGAMVGGVGGLSGVVRGEPGFQVGG